MFTVGLVIAQQLLGVSTETTTDPQVLSLTNTVVFLYGILTSLVGSCGWFYIKRYRPLRNMERYIESFIVSRELQSTINETLINIAKEAKEAETTLTLLYENGTASIPGHVIPSSDSFKRAEEGLKNFLKERKRCFYKTYDQFASWAPRTRGIKLQTREWRHYAKLFVVEKTEAKKTA